MQIITKRRLKAYFIDLAVATAITAGIECILRKKIKSEVVHIAVTPLIVPLALEYLQFKRNGQTCGYKTMGLILESEDGSKLTNKQITQRMFYNQAISSFKYMVHPAKYLKGDGHILPHDNVANTIVREI